MKKRFALALAMVLCLSLLTACGGKEEAPAASGGDAAATEDAQYTFTLSWEGAENASGNMALVYFKEAIEEQTGGKVTCNIYPNAQLGGSRDVFEGVQSGQITSMLCTNAVQSNFVPDALVFDMMFAFADSEVGRAILTDEGFYDALSASYEAVGFHIVTFIDAGFRVLTANNEVRTPADIAGQSIRTMENRLHLDVWSNIGANPSPLSFNELYTALQQGTMDCQENPIEMIATSKLYEQQKYIIETNHCFSPYIMVMSDSFYKSLPADIQEAVDAAGKAAYEKCLQYLDENVEAYKKTVEDYGCTIVELTDEELDQFVKLATPVWGSVKETVSPEVYNAYMAALEKATA